MPRRPSDRDRSCPTLRERTRMPRTPRLQRRGGCDYGWRSGAFEPGGYSVEDGSSELRQPERGAWGVPRGVHFEVLLVVAVWLADLLRTSSSGAQMNDQMLELVLSKDGSPALVPLLPSALVISDRLGDSARPAEGRVANRQVDRVRVPAWR